MHVSSHRASAGLSALNSQIAARTAGSARTGASTGNFSSTAAAGQHPPPPSGPPPSSDRDSSNSAGFNMQLSTSQFAGMGSAGPTPRAPKDFGELDSDGNGSVSSSEYGVDAADPMDQQLFAGIDQDSDGSLSSSEISTFESTMAAHGGRGRADDPIASLDSNNDGSLSGDEFGLSAASDQVQALFKAIDSDSDGSLSSTELNSFKDTMQSQMAGAQGAGRPHGPPPGPPPDEFSNSSNSSSSTSSSGSVEPAAKTDVSALLQRLAEQYFSPMGSSAQPALSLTA